MADPSWLNDAITRHYGREGLATSILDALQQAGMDVGNLKPADLELLDEMHIGRRDATLALARSAGITQEMYVIDVGSGMGGPARNIAYEFGCRVEGIDLTEEYCHVANMLTELSGLAGRVSFRQANALDLPFPQATFDVAWTQHTAMNLADKGRLYREMHRVLKPAGLLAIHDPVAGSVGPPHFPLPWARSPRTSFLVRPTELRRFLEEAGFTISTWQDVTAATLDSVSTSAKKAAQATATPLGHNLLLWSDFPRMARNYVQSLREGRIGLLQVVARK
jgi:ubiquinone/menaquinone biosynthesis C-methylase UbiE